MTPKGIRETIKKWADDHRVTPVSVDIEDGKFTLSIEMSLRVYCRPCGDSDEDYADSIRGGLSRSLGNELRWAARGLGDEPTPNPGQ